MTCFKMDSPQILCLPSKKESINDQAAQKAARAAGALLSVGDGVIELWLYAVPGVSKMVSVGVIRIIAQTALLVKLPLLKFRS